jgi:hypothetical protein
MRQAGQVTCMTEILNTYRIAAGNSEGQRPLGRHIHRWEAYFKNRYNVIGGSWDSAAGIATGYGLDDRGVGVRVPVGSRIFSSPCHREWLWGPSNHLSTGYQGTLSPGVKSPGCEAYHSPPTSAVVKKMWIYTITA